jgi:hypothetical protein
VTSLAFAVQLYPPPPGQVEVVFSRREPPVKVGVPRISRASATNHVPRAHCSVLWARSQQGHHQSLTAKQCVALRGDTPRGCACSVLILHEGASALALACDLGRQRASRHHGAALLLLVLTVMRAVQDSEQSHAPAILALEARRAPGNS